MTKHAVPVLTALALLLTGTLSLAATPDTSTSQETIVQIASADPDLSTLVTALSDADLVTTLEGKGPFIVFAPSNEAFAKLPKGLLDYLLANPKVLKEVLLYHVASSSAALSPTPFFTVEGEKVFPFFKYDASGLTTTINNSKVTAAPIQASNGVIYLIDSVLLPQF
jgi:uncharacterized surface protein with fasciclin (FAS1) repeats